LKLRVYNLILKIWKNEQIPEERTEGIICPVFKKGDRRLCNNYRPITLLNTVYKIFAILLHNRICTAVEQKIGEYQMSFRPNRSTIDNIFIIRQIYEKCHEHNTELHNAFVDFMQAFDSVNRPMIPECLKQYKVPRKLIKLVQATLQQTRVKVKINNVMTEQFEITSRV
jgi:sorting nexin-29